MATFKKVTDPGSGEFSLTEKIITSTCLEIHPDHTYELHLRFGDEQITLNSKEIELIENAMEGKDDYWDDDDDFQDRDDRDEYMCPECGEMRDVEEMCNPDGACDRCQESDEEE